MDCSLWFFGLFFKRAGKKLSKIVAYVKEDKEGNSFLTENKLVQYLRFVSEPNT